MKMENQTLVEDNNRKIAQFRNINNELDDKNNEYLELIVEFENKITLLENELSLMNANLEDEIELGIKRDKNL